MRLFSLLAVLSLVTLGAVAPELPPSEFADTEVSTNLPFAQPPANVGGMSLRLEFSGTPSNNVEVVLGTDADGDGVLSFDESALRIGWDCGRYFVERMDTGERFSESFVGTNVSRRMLDGQWNLRRGLLKAVAFEADGEGAFLSLTTNLPPWIYSAGWNTIRLTARGTDTLNESLSYAVTERGAVIILE